MFSLKCLLQQINDATLNNKKSRTKSNHDAPFFSMSKGKILGANKKECTKQTFKYNP